MKIKRRFFLSISFILLLTIILISFLFITIFYFFLEKLFSEKVFNSSKIISDGIVQIYLKYYNDNFNTFVKYISKIFESEKDLVDFYIVDMNGKICFSYDEYKNNIKYNKDERYFYIEFLDKIKSIESFYQKVYKDKNIRILIIHPFFDFYQRHTYSLVYYYSFNSLILKSLLLLLFSLSFSIFLIIFAHFYAEKLSIFILKPVNLLLQAIKLSHKEKYQTKINIKTDYEFCLLINEFNKLMQIIKNEKNLITNVIYSLKSGILVIDKNYSIILCNQSFCRLLNINNNQSENKNCFDLFPALNKIKDSIDNVLKNENPIQLKGEIFTQIPYSYFNIEIKPLIFDSICLGIIITIDDITKDIEIQKRLVQLQKGELINSIANGLAHDFNNLIGSIKNTAVLANAEINEKNVEKLPEIGEYLVIIYDIAKNAEKLVKHLLSLSKHKDFIKEKVNLINILDEVIKVSRKSIDKDVNIEFNSFINKNPIILGDDILLEELFFNLITNASHSMTIMRKDKSIWGGIITINIFEVEQYREKDISENCYIINSLENINKLNGKKVYKITISDIGIGIEKDNISKIFQPFFSTKPENFGTGLGRSMVKILTELHEGIIDLYSIPDKGSTFTIYLPAIN